MEIGKNGHDVKEVYAEPKILASYNKKELEDAVGIMPEGTPQNGGCGCGCSPG